MSDEWLARIRSVTPMALLRWSSVLFVISLYVLVIVIVVLAIVGHS